MTEETRTRIIGESFEDPEEGFAIPRSKFISRKSRTTTLFLCLFLGAFGAHRFYTGKIGTAFLMLFTLGGFGIWSLIDLFRIASGSFRDKRGRRMVWEPEEYRH